jgi:hypothetical protein
MSYPYPQDRNRARREKGEDPYREAKEAFAQERADLQEEAEAYGELNLRRQEEPELDDEERLAEINREVREEHKPG